MAEAPAIVQDGVQCDPPSGIDVLIVGAGVGGLTAALECHRKGHSVRVIERAATATAAGDQFTIGLSGRRWISHYPSMKAEMDSISIQNRMQYHQWTGEPIGEPFAMKAIGLPPHVMELMKNGPPMAMQMRPLFHQMLLHQLERFGIEITYSQKAALYWESAEKGKGCVMTDEGGRFEADVVLACDGLHSRSRDVVIGGQGNGKPSGQSLFRCAVPFDKVKEDPVVWEKLGLDGGKPMMRAFIGPGTHCMVLTYVDQAGENGTIAWGLNYYEPGEQSTRESWRNTVTSEEVIRTMDETNPGWSPAIKALVRATPKDYIVHWPLLWRDPNPCWHSKEGRVLQVGDAAHSFIPTSGNGATQAIEDAITIAECLRQAASPATVPLAVKTHNLLRSDRVSCAQLLGFVNQQRYHDTDFEVLKSDVSKVSAKVPKWIWTHDPEKYARARYAEASGSLTEGGEGRGFANTNFPVGHELRSWTLEELERLRAEGKSAESLCDGDWS